MISVIDIYSLTLLVISLAIFIVRYFREEPPVTPYLIIACTCAIGNFLGEAGGQLGAIALLTAASFLFLGCLLHPAGRSPNEPREENAATDGPTPDGIC